MIKLFRHKNDKEADAIQNRFEQLVLAYGLEYLDEEDSPGFYIKDGGQKIKKGEQLAAWLGQLEAELIQQRSLTGDACYIDPETGQVC